MAIDLGFLKTDSGKDFEFVGQPFFGPPEILGIGAGIAVRKEDGALRDAFNKALGEMVSDGTYKKLNEKYFPFALN